MGSKIELLKQKVDKAEGKEKIVVLNNLAFALHTTDLLLTEKYANQALLLAIELNIPSKIARSNNNIGILYQVRNDKN